MGAEEDDTNVGIIDWEFASIGRGINEDMSQMLAHLQLFRIAAEWHNEVYLHRALDTLIIDLIDDYRGFRVSDRGQWLAKPTDGSLQARLMRSTFLSYGAEMVNCAFWKVWPCNDQRCGTPHPKEPHQCKLVGNMVKQGIWYLTHSGQDEQDFLSDVNWKVIKEEETVMRLFWHRIRAPKSSL